jgi:putative ABC transport system ATP-binding protein
MLLEARSLKKLYRRGPEEVHALQGASFALGEGEIVALMGPSGSGKTTVMNIVAGWEAQDEGEVVWRGGSSIPQPPPWEFLAIVPQTLGLIEELTVLENVELPARLAGRLDDRHRRRAAELLEMLGLSHLAEREPFDISLGEQQRTAIARALLLSPRILLADEPTGHQDVGWEGLIFQALKEAAASGTTSFVATHNHEVVKHIDRLLNIRDGVVEEGDAGEQTAPHADAAVIPRDPHEAFRPPPEAAPPASGPDGGDSQWRRSQD